MILMDYIFRISLGLAILFFGVAVAYFFGMNVKKLIFDVKEMEDNMPKETSRSKQVINKLEAENIKMARKQKNDSGRMKLSKSKEEKMPRTKDGFVDMNALTPKEKPVYVHDKKGRLQSNQVPFVDEDDIYDPNNDATGKMESPEPAKAEQTETSYLAAEDIGTSYLDANDAIVDEDAREIHNDDSLNNQLAGVKKENLKEAGSQEDETSFLGEEDQSDETSFLGEEEQTDETSYLNPQEAEEVYPEYTEPEEEETDHTSYLEPQPAAEKEESGDETSFLASEEYTEEPAQSPEEEEEEEEDATSMLTSEEYPGYAYVYDESIDGYHDDAELELSDIGEQVEDGTTFLNQEELGVVKPQRKAKNNKKNKNRRREESDSDATSYLDYIIGDD